jgi:hypothetical protein
MGVMWDDATVISVWALGDVARLLEKEETWCESCEYSLDDTNPELEAYLADTVIALCRCTQPCATGI